MNIDIAQFNLAITALLPVLVALVAGALRQRGWPHLVNEGISAVVVLGIAVAQALLGEKLGGSPQADFLIVAAYTSALLHSPLIAPLQAYMQDNVLSFLGSGKSVPAPTGVAALDSQSVAQELLAAINMPTLALLIAQEISKIRLSQVQPPPPMPPPIYQQPTQASVGAVRANTPPIVAQQVQRPNVTQAYQPLQPPAHGG